MRRYTLKQARGDAFVACVASLLETPPALLPDSVEEINDWLRAARKPFVLTLAAERRIPRSLHKPLIMVGGLAGGAPHWVIQQGNQLIHDPVRAAKPGQYDGLDEVKRIGTFAVLDPMEGEKSRWFRGVRLCRMCGTAYQSVNRKCCDVCRTPRGEERQEVTA